MKRVHSLACVLAAFVVFIIMAFTALSQNQKNIESSKTSTTAHGKTEQSAPNGTSVIGHLERRDKIITITKGPKGPLYTVKTKDGKIIAKKIDEKNLQAKYPDIYHQIKSGVAGNDATLR